MKKVITTMIAAGLMTSGAMAGASATADFASAYVFRGQTFNDGFVIQPGIEADGLGMPEEWGSVAVGVWGNIDINEPSPGAQTSEFSEVDWYAAYGLPSLVEGLDIGIGYTEYTYPMGGVTADKEVSLGLGYDLGESGFGLGANLYSMIGGFFVGQYYADLSAAYSYEVNEGLEVGAGALVSYIKQGSNVPGYNAGGAEDGLNTFELDASLTYALGDVWSVGASVAYIGQLDDQVLVDINDATGTGAYDVDIVGMLSVGASF